MEKLITYGIPLVTFITGAISFYGASAQKRYAAQRDFRELKESYLEMVKHLDEMKELIDRRIDHQERILIEIKTLLYLKNGKDL